MKILKNVKLAAMAALALTFTACSDDEEPSGSGQANVEVTDAPVDNAEVEGVFVTITDIKIDGQSAASFDGATTVDLLALQNGRTELLASKELNAGVYNNITFTLDLASDASGNHSWIICDDQFRQASIRNARTKHCRFSGFWIL